ncbi:nitroreductase family protein [Candidatus Bipolaricaulota bacterium]
MNETLRLIHDRVSVRRYEQRPIEPGHIDAIVHSAIRAPTAGNLMLYSILQIDDPHKKARLAETCEHVFIADAPLVLLFLADMQRWHDYYQAFNVPQYCQREGLSFDTPDAGKLMMACCDALLAAQNSVIAAESLGIGSCYIGDILGHCKEHRALFELPPWTFPIALLCYGYVPDESERKPRERFDRRFIHHQDVYRRLNKSDFLQMMAGIEAKFADFLRKKERSLAEQTYLSFTSGEAGREHARSVETMLDGWLSKPSS